MITKIISGGQTGADRAGLDAAIVLGLNHGGYAPKDYRCEDGSLLAGVAAKRYKLIALKTASYAPRTRRNILAADLTLVFGDTSEGGTSLTCKLCRELWKPVLINPDAVLIRQWCLRADIHVVNVAGNRESKQPGIHDRVFYLLVRALTGISDLSHPAASAEPPPAQSASE